MNQQHPSHQLATCFAKSCYRVLRAAAPTPSRDQRSREAGSSPNVEWVSDADLGCDGWDGTTDKTRTRTEAQTKTKTDRGWGGFPDT